MSSIEGQIVGVTQFFTGSCWKLDTGELDFRVYEIWTFGWTSEMILVSHLRRGSSKLCAALEVCANPSDWEL